MNDGPNAAERRYILIQQGDERAFRELFDELARPLVYFGIKLTGDRVQAEDAASEAFQVLWQHRQDIASYASMRSYLYTVVHRRCLDFLKHRRVVQLAQTKLQEPSDAVHDIDARMVQAETMGAIYAAVEALPAHHREIIRRSFIEEISTKEIAAAQGKSEAHIRTTRARAVAALRAVLRERGLLEAAVLCWEAWQKNN